MKVERWQEETDEEWVKRLAYETKIANDTETTQYFIERDQYNEDGFIINYIREDGWAWKEHPEGPFSCKQALDWKKKAELYDEETPILKEIMTDKQTLVDGMTDKLEAIKSHCEEYLDHTGTLDAADFLAGEILEMIQSLRQTTKE